jgi:hypothetical protein
VVSDGLVRMRGIRSAIAALPPHQRRAIKATLLNPAESLLPPMSLVWGIWPDVLTGSGLGFLSDHRGRREAAE